ncbi:MAG: S1/P1 Nuclease [Candidatus Marinimicrobia bacterium]|nr:S1/P1 Nuclease [Candidatus Neomarinimicrobiota bacterium]MBT4155052.1 S1/P1 Nuclease [Candidatus Neomarinimicrobiota bacterium]MBT4554751.1 S1/P1 Nuclease [Candidatus Neomarinimicrobiota bacterium]MBT5115683.1 S1/P1 Nuclease [Candidatus Neomarinimicrobiota bacterium]MBT6413175.1 S1/P1 Nuclease [Candidatus Neomarinimicrobiota bacterium]
MKILFKLLLITLLSIQPLMAWGNTGHRIVGKVAEQYITKNAELQIKRILGHSDLSRVSTWADEIKSDPNWKHAWDWHFCTIPDNENYISGKYTGDAIEKMNDFIATLKNKKSSKEEKQIALKFMIHLVGDLHQPLHVGRKNDKGGNDIKIKWFGEETNLHSIWDTKLIQHQNLSYTEYTDYLLLDIDYSDIRKWQGHSTMDYIRESKALRTQCYDFSGNSLKWEYFYKNKDLLELRLVQGGIRLSGELNRIFK